MGCSQNQTVSSAKFVYRQAAVQNPQQLSPLGLQSTPDSKLGKLGVQTSSSALSTAIAIGIRGSETTFVTKG